MSTTINTQSIFNYFQSLQKNIVSKLNLIEKKTFSERQWSSKLGKGKGVYVEDGEILERAFVGFSQVSADSLPSAASIKRPELSGKPYEAMGVSLVIHPRNPYAPTGHLNVRFFCAKTKEPTWWFGGGMDLTPYYGFDEDCRHFHATCKNTLDKHDEKFYASFKKKCDEYFHIKHRKQNRGIGGIFFDDFNNNSFNESLALVKDVGDSFVDAYLPIVEKRIFTKYDDAHRAHQLFRRGRYVEFNLVQDRGTLFGLQSKGDADAILMSLPPQASWDVSSEKRNPEDEKQLATSYLVPRDWA